MWICDWGWANVAGTCELGTWKRKWESDVVNTVKCEFLVSISLKTHVNLKHGNEIEKEEESDAGNTFIESFKCDECEFMADNKQSLKTHVDLKHGNENEEYRF